MAALNQAMMLAYTTGDYLAPLATGAILLAGMGIAKVWRFFRQPCRVCGRRLHGGGPGISGYPTVVHGDADAHASCMFAERYMSPSARADRLIASLRD
jgi:hypothetical protein